MFTIDGMSYAERFPKEQPEKEPWNHILMSHEGEDLHNVKMFNLKRNSHNQGNEWWIFTWDGKPIETWSTESRARCFLREQNKFKATYGVPECMLYRCMPGVGFIRQES